MSEIELSPEQLKIVIYPHPGLRHVAKPIRRVDATLKAVAARMIDLMYEHRGVGLAATQVDVPLRMFVWNPSGNRDEEEARVYINPTITRPRNNEIAEEGCLSLPGLNADVVRAKTIHMHAYEIGGQEIDQDFSGFEARILQHETDHLDGVMFFDRLTEQGQREIQHTIGAFQRDFESLQRLGSILPLDRLASLRAAWESRYA